LPGDEESSIERSGIGTAEVFRVLSAKRLERLEPQLYECTFEPRRVLYFEGTPADRLWVVREGQVRLYKASANGQITTLDVLGAGEVFGALTTIEHETYPSSAEPITEGRAWWTPRATLLRLLDSEPMVAVEILGIVSRRLRHAEDRLRAFANDPAPARLAAAILEATSRGTARITRRALAEAAGTAVETAIRVLRRFERDGILQGKVGRVEVLDRKRLERIACGGSL